MKKYKIGNRIITANSPVEAVKVSKMLDSSVVRLTMKDDYITQVGRRRYQYTAYGINKMGFLKEIGNYDDRQRAINEAKKAKPLYNYDKVYVTYIGPDTQLKEKTIFTDSLDKSTNLEIEYLTKEEERAVDDYRKAIAGTTNPKLLELYKHILDEELEHIRELENADVEDSVKDYAPPYAIWVKKDGKWIIFGGANSTNVDKRRFLNSGYEDVTVVENGKEPTQDCDMKDMGFQPNFGTIFTFSPNGNKEYIVTNTNGPTINNQHTFEYREYIDGKESGPTRQMSYATAKKDVRLKKL